MTDKIEQPKKNMNQQIGAFSENAQTVRRNLIFFSAIAIFYKLSEASIDTEKSVNIFGLILKGINDQYLSLALAIICLYHLCHFIFFVFEHLIEHNHLTSKIKTGNLGNGASTLVGKIQLNRFIIMEYALPIYLGFYSLFLLSNLMYFLFIFIFLLVLLAIQWTNFTPDKICKHILNKKQK